MRVDAGDVDMLLFGQFVRQADEAGMQQRADDEIRYLRDALRLWRGPHPLLNVPGHAFRDEIVALEQRRRRAAARLFELEFARENYEGILDELTVTVGYYPADRRLCEELMLAEYRWGHVAAATAAYERHRAALAEETGNNPDTRLRNLHFAIATGDDPAVAAAQAELTKSATGAAAQVAVPVPAQLRAPPRAGRVPRRSRPGTRTRLPGVAHARPAGARNLVRR